MVVEYAVEIDHHRNDYEAISIFGPNLHKQFNFDAGT